MSMYFIDEFGRKAVASTHCFPYIQFETRKERVEHTCNKLLPHLEEFDTIVLSGYSSATIGSIVAHELEKNLAIAPKATDKRNSGLLMEAVLDARAVFVDDLISSGKTVERVVTCIKNTNIEYDASIQLVAVCLWQQQRWNNTFILSDMSEITLW